MNNLIFILLLVPFYGQAQKVVVGQEARGFAYNNITDYDDGEAYKGESEDILKYLTELGIEYADEKYIVFYPWGNDAYSDHHFTQFLTTDYDYRDLIFVMIYSHSLSKSATKNIISEQKEYLYFDYENIYQHQPFYNYTPFVVQFHKNKVFQKWHLSYKHALPIKFDLFKELK